MMEAYKERGRMVDYPSEVYFNLHKHCFSMKQDGLVVLHSDLVVLKDVIFKVSAAGRERVRETGVKNVHARVYGYYQEDDELYDLDEFRQAYYNPYKVETFVDRETLEPINTAEMVVLMDKKIYYK